MNTARQSSVADEPPIGLSATELDALHANEWFRRLPLQAQRAILEHCSIWRVPAHQTIATQGSMPDVWFGVAAGAVALSARGTAQRETIIDLLEPGQWFGDAALLTGAPAPYRATTWASSTLLLMRRSALRELLAAHSEIGPALLHLSWMRSARLLERITDQSEPRLDQRARRLFSSLGARFGYRTGGVTRITLSMTQTQIAALVDASRQRVNELIVRLERQGVIRRSQTYMDLTHQPTRSTSP